MGIRNQMKSWWRSLLPAVFFQGQLHRTQMGALWNHSPNADSNYWHHSQVNCKEILSLGYLIWSIWATKVIYKADSWFYTTSAPQVCSTSKKLWPTVFFLFFPYFVFGSYLDVFRAYSWLREQGSLLAGIDVNRGCQRSKPRIPMSKASAWPAILLLHLRTPDYLESSSL